MTRPNIEGMQAQAKAAALGDRLKQAVADYKAMPPLEQAIHEMAQRRSFVRGQMDNTPTDKVDEILDKQPEFVLLKELLRLRAYALSLEAERDRFQARVKELEAGYAIFAASSAAAEASAAALEEAAKICEKMDTPSVGSFEGAREIAAAIRALAAEVKTKS